MRSAVMLLGLILSTHPASPDGVCVEAVGDYVDSCLVTKDCQEPTPEEAEGVRLIATARRMTNAGCNDNPVFSTLKVYAYRDGTKIEVTTFMTAIWTSATEERARELVGKMAVPIRPGEPVVVWIAPVRLGNPEPLVVATVTGAPENPTVEFLIHPTWAKPKRALKKK